MSKQRKKKVHSFGSVVLKEKVIFFHRSEGMSCSSSSGSEEDDEGFDSYRKGGYHAVRVGDQFAGGRFIAQRKLGWGQFSTVWLAYDTSTSVCYV